MWLFSRFYLLPPWRASYKKIPSVYIWQKISKAHTFLCLFSFISTSLSQLFFLTASVRFDFLYPNSKHCNRSIIFDGHLETNAALIFINKAKWMKPKSLTGLLLSPAVSVYFLFSSPFIPSFLLFLRKWKAADLLTLWKRKWKTSRSANIIKPIRPFFIYTDRKDTNTTLACTHKLFLSRRSLLSSPVSRNSSPALPEGSAAGRRAHARQINCLFIRQTSSTQTPLLPCLRCLRS